MATCAVEGQAVGTAAAQCIKQGLLPRQLAQDKAKVRQLQQTLLRNDQSIKGLAADDPADLAPAATVTASAEDPERPATSVIDGYVRHVPGEATTHLWAAPLGADGAWIELAWSAAQKIGQVQITFDSGFQRELTLSASNAANKHLIRAPQPETVKDYLVQYRSAADGPWIELAAVTGNHQRFAGTVSIRSTPWRCGWSFRPPMATRRPGFSKSAAMARAAGLRLDAPEPTVVPAPPRCSLPAGSFVGPILARGNREG